MAHPNQIYVLRDVMGDKILPVYNQPPSTRHPSGLVGIRKLWQDKLNENQQLSNIPTKKRCKKIKKSGTSTRRQVNKLVQMGLLKVVECEKTGETALPGAERKYYQVVPEMKRLMLWGHHGSKIQTYGRNRNRKRNRNQKHGEENGINSLYQTCCEITCISLSHVGFWFFLLNHHTEAKFGLIRNNSIKIK